MKAPSAGYVIKRLDASSWVVRDAATDQVVWGGKTFIGARNAHYRLSLTRITGQPVSTAQARRAGNV